MTIFDLLPILKKGWIAMDKDGMWNIYYTKPKPAKKYNIWVTNKICKIYPLPKNTFDIAPFDGDWTKSLIKIK